MSLMYVCTYVPRLRFGWLEKVGKVDDSEGDVCGRVGREKGLVREARVGGMDGRMRGLDG